MPRLLGGEFLLLELYYLEKRCLDPVPESRGQEGFSVLPVLNFLLGTTENPALDDRIWALDDQGLFLHSKASRHDGDVFKHNIRT